jgi:demethylmenaquinone methyltransferase/2-methoxy-6-polyprenyl-1,4-benzoquinol methylase
MATIPEAKPTRGAEREDQVRTLFSEIAPRYDLLNHVLSLNIDRGWRRRAIRMLRWQEHKEGTYLDACAGTYDLSLELAKQSGFQGSVIATDFALPMLVQGRGKLGSTVIPVCADTQPFRLAGRVLRLRPCPPPRRPARDSGVHGAAESCPSRPL